MEMVDKTTSPFSDLPPIKIEHLPRSRILDELERYYGIRPPLEAVECDYAIWRCVETGLEFAWPMRSGNLCFYEWISQFDSYYPGIRWEHKEVSHLVRSVAISSRDSFRVLDVGCGNGGFLHSLNFLHPTNRFGIDFNERAVASCRQQGFKAFCGTIESALQQGFAESASFSVVTSFHCLEHVETPIEFVRCLLRITEPGGRLFLSTPYSPMSFESEWFDILNHPPHHVTRWNVLAYRRLAQKLNVKVRFYFPPSSPLRQAMGAFRLRQYGPDRCPPRTKYYMDLLRRLPTLAQLYLNQRQRTRNHEGIAADTILAELTLP